MPSDQQFVAGKGVLGLSFVTTVALVSGAVFAFACGLVLQDWRPGHDESGAQSVGIDESLAEAKAFRQKDPGRALTLLERCLKLGIKDVAIHLQVLELLGDIYAFLKRHDVARKHHHNALNIKKRLGVAASEIAIMHATVATDCMLSFDLSAALEHLRHAQAIQLPPEAQSVLYKQEAAVHECGGDFVSALHRFEHAAKLAPSQIHSTEHLLKHLELLKRTMASADDMPMEVRKSMEGHAQHLAGILIHNGPWESMDQLPGTYLPGLTARPWHSLVRAFSGSLDGVWSPWMDPAAMVVRLKHKDLLAEYDSLSSKGLLRRETECIHEHGGGEWRRFEANGFWEARNAHGCATASPIACSLFQELIDLGMPLIRAGYSAVGPGAWLKPHFGMTNGQLKWHLGLRIPGDDCAMIRVSNETRAWRQGELLFFDDSFDHEVWNRCNGERVVFQVVFVHPELAGREGGQIYGTNNTIASH